MPHIMDGYKVVLDVTHVCAPMGYCRLEACDTEQDDWLSLIIRTSWGDSSVWIIYNAALIAFNSA